MYIVIELQTESDSVSPIINSYSTINQAYQKYYSILSAAAVSSVKTHTAMIVSENGEIITAESFSSFVVLDHGRTSAGRTSIRYLNFAGTCQVLSDLRNYHICLIYSDPVTDAESKFLHNTDIVNTRAADCRALEFNRVKYSHRIDKPGSRRTPLDHL